MRSRAEISHIFPGDVRTSTFDIVHQERIPSPRIVSLMTRGLDISLCVMRFIDRDCEAIPKGLASRSEKLPGSLFDHFAL